MTTINISLPAKLKIQAETLVRNGFYVSFSDLIRDSLRQTINRSRYDMWAEEAKTDLKTGKAVVLKSKQEIDKYFDSI
jgi:Arc/MetJ-type ribon-helix-helix transcriptional regulator